MPRETRRLAFVLRIWQDKTGRVWGQITEPISGWHGSFADLGELWALLTSRLQSSSGRDAPSSSSDHVHK